MSTINGIRSAAAARSAALADLDFHWGGAYDVAAGAGGWVASRRDDGRPLVAGSPDELRALILADYSARPVPRDLRADPPCSRNGA
jgi:hypothetical protein